LGSAGPHPPVSPPYCLCPSCRCVIFCACRDPLLFLVRLLSPAQSHLFLIFFFFPLSSPFSLFSHMPPTYPRFSWGFSPTVFSQPITLTTQLFPSPQIAQHTQTTATPRFPHPSFLVSHQLPCVKPTRPKPLSPFFVYHPSGHRLTSIFRRKLRVPPLLPPFPISGCFVVPIIVGETTDFFNPPPPPNALGIIILCHCQFRTLFAFISETPLRASHCYSLYLSLFSLGFFSVSHHIPPFPHPRPTPYSRPLSSSAGRPGGSGRGRVHFLTLAAQSPPPCAFEVRPPCILLDSSFWFFFPHHTFNYDNSFFWSAPPLYALGNW